MSFLRARSKMTTVLSTEEVAKLVPPGDRRNEKMGWVCADNVASGVDVLPPATDQMRTRPSYAPVMSVEPSRDQSAAVTSPTAPLRLGWLSTRPRAAMPAASLDDTPPAPTVHSRAVASCAPDARTACPGAGDHEQKEVFPSWPRRTATLSVGSADSCGVPDRGSRFTSSTPPPSLPVPDVAVIEEPEAVVARRRLDADEGATTVALVHSCLCRRVKGAWHSTSSPFSLTCASICRN
mmetsp:Transcript_16891/g.52815  ORF Transcript_16891/g.52815 Transcript_16891/m.52815 type:complete len:237 (+) Transcript_16891:469-1179(+)